jgi:predicted Zn finger-like uncharacterized protein
VPIEVNCPHCGKVYRLAESQVGKKVECRKCSEGFTVRAPDDREEERPRSRDRDRDRDRDDDDRPRRRDRDDPDDDDRPRRRGRDAEDDRPRRRKSGGMSGLMLGLLIGGPILLVLVVVLILVFTMGGGLGNRVTQANADRIKMGMSEAEVNAIIGAGLDYEAALDKRASRLSPDEAKAVQFIKGMMEMSKRLGVTVKIHEGYGDDYISVAYQNGRVANAKFGNWRRPERFR